MRNSFSAYFHCSLPKVATLTSPGIREPLFRRQQIFRAQSGSAGGPGRGFLLTWSLQRGTAFLVSTYFLDGANEMSTFGLIEYNDASPEVRAVYDDIMATRKTDWINNFWKAIAHDPALLKRTWEDIKQVMAPGAIDPLTKELLYVAVSVTNNCQYCIASHTASAFNKGMTPEMFKELQAIIGMANETNKLVTGYQVEIDEQFKPPLKK